MNEDKNTNSALGMSDDDWLNADIPDYDSDIETTDFNNLSTDEEDTHEEENEETQGVDQTEDTTDEASDGVSDDSDEGWDDEYVEEDEDGDSEAEEPSEDSDTENVEEDKETSDIDYKATHEKLFAPFKANGKEMQIDNVDDAITLMQMGANYNKKMAALKPSLKILKMLEKNNLLDESKLNFLIDLDKKNPGAINKLLQDSKIDPMDLDTEDTSGYKPNTYTVDDREIELDTVLESLSHTETFNQLVDVIGNKWDGASRQVFADNPQLLEVINTHMANGIYRTIEAEVEKQRNLGRLNGVNDIEAYKQVGDMLHASGGFDHLNIRESNQTQPRKRVVKPKSSKAEDANRRNRKRAASSTKTSVSKKPAEDFNPLSMSDAEFEKLINDQYL